MNKITTRTALENDKYEMIITGYEDEDYTVFREKNMKEKQTIWLHIHDKGWTGVFINEHQFLRTLSNWEELDILNNAIFGNLASDSAQLN